MTRARDQAADTPVADIYLQAWQCIGCGRIEAPQTCIGVCRDRKVFFIGRDEHEAALAEITRLRAELDAVSSSLLRFERAVPRDGQWERAWIALQAEVRELRTHLAAVTAGGE
ncbi:MAG TPA: hypothetical protein PKO41_08265 [Dokdonella sp.]|uniref:hypothetical protein n=1 Tax=Dokdonella sp. TaxID=2291710 RepID=UPI0025C1ED63|nr:hypothetical protein [Dokdonella sp.]MBX3691393.1 hypothetical protein [Dokdonella sp.]MCW5566739.1 hypothetical protein [Dokdonella sp.]HNR92404.1 hypothetical protein [Dokdonella sp.]